MGGWAKTINRTRSIKDANWRAKGSPDLSVAIVLGVVSKVKKFSHKQTSMHSTRNHHHQGALESESFRKRLKIRHILEQSLFFKTPYVWDDRRPRPRLKERSPCRAIGHVHERCLDPASDVMVAAVLPV